MSRCAIRLLVVFVAALATTFAPLPANAVPEPSCDDCCGHATHATDDCVHCVVCPTGLNCVLPADSLFHLSSPPVVGRILWLALSGETRSYPPPLPPPRPAA